MTPDTGAAALADQELVELMGLIEQSDSVELKVTIPDETQRSTVTDLEVDPLTAQLRQIFFFDTPDLALNEAGVVVRARRIQGRPHDTVIKLRPVVPSELPEQLRRSPSMKVEVDAMPSGFVCSASLKGRVGDDDVADAVAGKLKLRKLFTKEQRTFFKAHAPKAVELDSLSILGPIFVLKLKFSPKVLNRKVVAEVWLYPDGSRILELSTKCDPSEAFQVAAEVRAALVSRGVDMTREQATKTKTALEFFSAELRG